MIWGYARSSHAAGLLDAALKRKPLGQSTTRATVEEARRRAAETAEAAKTRRATDQSRYLERLAQHADLAVLFSEEMWR
jgi:hypothetical protein